MKHYSIILSLLILTACGSEQADNTTNAEQSIEAEESYENVGIHIKIADEYSLVKNDTASDVPTYLISSLDSFVVDVSDYQFDEGSVFYRYLDSQDEFLQMIGSSFGWINIYYNDTVEMITGYPIEIEENKVFALVPKIERVEGPLPTEFKLTFGIYIDNGRGMVDFDEFKVKVVKRK